MLDSHRPRKPRAANPASGEGRQPPAAEDEPEGAGQGEHARPAEQGDDGVEEADEGPDPVADRSPDDHER